MASKLKEISMVVRMSVRADADEEELRSTVLGLLADAMVDKDLAEFADEGQDDDGTEDEPAYIYGPNWEAHKASGPGWEAEVLLAEELSPGHPDGYNIRIR